MSLEGSLWCFRDKCHPWEIIVLVKGQELPQDTLNISGIKAACRVPAHVNKLWSYAPESCGHFSRTNIYIPNIYMNRWHLAAYKRMKCKDLFTLLPRSSIWSTLCRSAWERLLQRTSHWSLLKLGDARRQGLFISYCLFNWTQGMFNAFLLP